MPVFCSHCSMRKTLRGYFQIILISLLLHALCSCLLKKYLPARSLPESLIKQNKSVEELTCIHRCLFDGVVIDTEVLTRRVLKNLFARHCRQLWVDVLVPIVVVPRQVRKQSFVSFETKRNHARERPRWWLTIERPKSSTFYMSLS